MSDQLSEAVSNQMDYEMNLLIARARRGGWIDNQSQSINPSTTGSH